MTLLSPEQQSSWDSLCAKRKEIQDRLSETDRALRELASQVFLSTLSLGRWKFDVDARDLIPVDKETNDLLDEMLATALSLGYHGSFEIYAKDINIIGYINDGELSINVGRHKAKTDLPSEMKRLAINVDMKDFIIQTLQYELDKETRNLLSTQQKIAGLGTRLMELE